LSYKNVIDATAASEGDASFAKGYVNGDRWANLLSIHLKGDQVVIELYCVCVIIIVWYGLSAYGSAGYNHGESVFAKV
jgi:hypothetical protein